MTRKWEFTVPDNIPEPPEGYTEFFVGPGKKGSYWLFDDRWVYNDKDDASAFCAINVRKPQPIFNPMDHVSKEKPVAFRTREGRKVWVLLTDDSPQSLRGVLGTKFVAYYSSGEYELDYRVSPYDLVALWEDEEDLDGPVTAEWVETTFKTSLKKEFMGKEDYYFSRTFTGWNLCLHKSGPGLYFFTGTENPIRPRIPQEITRRTLLEALKEYKR